MTARSRGGPAPAKNKTMKRPAAAATIEQDPPSASTAIKRETTVKKEAKESPGKSVPGKDEGDVEDEEEETSAASAEAEEKESEKSEADDNFEVSRFAMKRPASAKAGGKAKKACNLSSYVVGPPQFDDELGDFDVQHFVSSA